MEQPSTPAQSSTSSMGHSFNSALTSQSVQRPGSSLQYPNAPQPESTPAQVQQFLIQVFLINRLGLDESEANEAAEALAAKIHVTGYGLYMLSKETLVGTLGLEGEVIYRILQDGQYRYEGGPWPALKIVSRILRLVAGGSGAYQLGKEGKDRNLTVSYICVGLITFIIALYYLCTTKRVVNSKRFWPERIKVRNKTAAGALSFVPW